ncbi:hypothetical protein KUTeg_019704 [Tegillarca granosa]|uniref:WW domain-containing oxidoreductase n=1 Tax=Tegillarca granosa TaxID=220873 RepID=A0ABQ9EDE0_TEGGR|nr:hypothetical protein KUTeg_019704 [Tegillarca granosa]
MSASIVDTDSDDEFPAGWEERVTLEGKVFYVNHETKTTQWTHPTTGKKKIVKGELPYGWERKILEDGTVCYIDHINQKTTYTDPRLAFAEEVKDSPYDFRQRFDGNSRALQVLQGRDLTGKYIIVTGANSGIGFETARAFAMHGARVILACRNMKSAEESRRKILKERPEAKLEIMEIDLASLKSVHQFSENYKQKKWYDKYSETVKTEHCLVLRPLHLLILNAAVFGLPYTKTEDDLEMTFQVNHLSHFYLTKLLLDLLVKSSPSKVIVVSSESHRFTDLSCDNICEEKLSPSPKNYQDMRAYNLSKLCNVLFSSHLDKIMHNKGVASLSLHPGNMMYTSLARNWWLYRMLFFLVRPFTKSMEQGAATTVYCATASELDGVGGIYFNNCCRCPPSSAAEDSELAQKLWDISEKMILDRVNR